MVLLAAGCAPRPLIARALAARGGPLVGVVREVEGQVAVGLPGTWRWRTAYRVPDRYAWTIYTTGEPDHYVFDGTVARTYVGSRVVTTEDGATAPLRTHARFTAVANLDVLLLPGVQLAPLAAADLPSGAAAGLEAVFADDASRYRLGFDARGLVVAVEGPVALPPAGVGRLEARFTDFRAIAGRVLPYRTTYTFNDRPLATELALAVCPNPRDLTPDVFTTPAGIPACVQPGGPGGPAADRHMPPP